MFAGTADGGWVYALESATKKTKAPVLLLLHGAGGSSVRFIRRFTDLADQTGIIIVAPKSTGVTWDAMNGPIGVDVARIDRVLNQVSRA